MEEVGQHLKKEEDDSSIAREIPIYCSKQLQNNLHILQFSHATEEDHKIQKIFIRPENREIKLEVKPNTEFNRFDLPEAEHTARTLNIDNIRDNPDLYISNKSCKNVGKYAIGCFNGKEFHMIPLSGFLEMRPMAPTIEKPGKRKKEGHVDTDEEDDAVAAAQQVTVKFGRLNKNKEVKNVNKELEKWTECTWHDENSTLSKVQKIKLYAENTDDHNQASSLKPMEYLRDLIPEDTEACDNLVVSSHSNNNLMQQCKTILKDVKICKFLWLQQRVTTGDSVTTEELLNCISQLAVLVHGNWVVNSDIFYSDDYVSVSNGLSSDVMQKARYYILYQFTQHQHVFPKDHLSGLRIPREELLEILSDFAKLDGNNCWRLLLETDTDFIHKHSAVVQRQKVHWEERWKQVSKFFHKDTKEKVQRNKTSSFSEDNEKNRGRKRGCSTSDSDSMRRDTN